MFTNLSTYAQCENIQNLGIGPGNETTLFDITYVYNTFTDLGRQ